MNINNNKNNNCRIIEQTIELALHAQLPNSRIQSQK